MNRWIEYLIEQGYIEHSSGAVPQATKRALSADISDWPEEWREIYEERAAIMECDGGLTRSKAEERAEDIVRTMYDRSAMGYR